MARVLLLGGNGFLGPHVVRELEGDYELLVTDLERPQTEHAARALDVADWYEVRQATVECDAVVNCSVQRLDRCGAFEVNAKGTLNAVRAAAEAGHARFVNTGPRFTVAGPSYLVYDFGIHEEAPPHPGTDLYALSKSLGQEACRVFAARYPIHVLTLLFSSFVEAASPRKPQDGMNPFAVTFADAARGVRCALEAELDALPSRCEVFFMSVDLPQDQVRHGKAGRLLGWEPQDTLESHYRNNLP